MKSLFVEKDGKWTFTPPKEDVSGPKSAKAKWEREARQTKEQLDALRVRLTVDGEDLTGEETLAELLELRARYKAEAGKEMVPRTEI